MNIPLLRLSFLSAVILAAASVPGRDAAAQTASPFPIDQVADPQLLAFDGVRELAGTAARLGMLTQVLEFSIAVGADGTPTGCTLARKFRSPSVSRQLCDILVRRSRFQPAVDAAGNPVSGTYRGSIDFRSFVDPDR
jgi:hypothetical protein